MHVIWLKYYDRNECDKLANGFAHKKSLRLCGWCNKIPRLFYCCLRLTDYITTNFLWISSKLGCSFPNIWIKFLAWNNSVHTSFHRKYYFSLFSNCLAAQNALEFTCSRKLFNIFLSFVLRHVTVHIIINKLLRNYILPVGNFYYRYSMETHFRHLKYDKQRVAETPK